MTMRNTRNTFFRSAALVALAVLLGLPAGPARAQDDPLLAETAETVAALIAPEPGGYEAIFSEAFLAQVPPAQLTAIFTDYHEKYGAVVQQRLEEQQGPGSGRFAFVTDGGYSIPVTLSVATAPPHLVQGLWLGAPTRLAASLEAVVEELAALPGQVSFELVRLGADGPERLAALAPDAPLAIGSAFKLYVLAELVRSIRAGERSWADVVHLDAAAVSLPSGLLQDWPVGAPLTLHTLATLMISRSDNTATDLLLDVLGRERVEAVQRLAGHARPDANVPFLKTLEMFKLKGDPDGLAAERFLEADAAGRRALLEREVAALPREGLVLFEDGLPAYIDQIEWFASAEDLVRVMSWLRTHTESGPAAAARGVLSVNAGLQFREAAWPFIGFKGGSEPGVLNLTFLLQSDEGTWYALSAGWNDPDAPVELNTLAGLVQRAVQLIE